MRSLLLSLAFLMLTAQNAAATTCRNWERLDDYQKIDTVDRMITQALRGNAGREFSSVNRSQVERCLQSNVENISYAIDDECDRDGGMNAPRGVLRDYIWSCVR